MLLKGPVKTISKWMQDARLKWQLVQERHEQYVLTKNSDDESERDTEWIRKEAKRIRDIEMSVDAYIESADEEKIQEEETKRIKEAETKELWRNTEMQAKKDMEEERDLREIVSRKVNQKKKFVKIIERIEKDIVTEGDEIEYAVDFVIDNLGVLEKCKVDCEDIQQKYEIAIDKMPLEDSEWLDEILDRYHEIERKAKLFINRNKEVRHTVQSNLQMEKIKFDQFD